MLGELLGSTNKERVLLYLIAREKGYAREITRFYDTPLNPIQKALDGLGRACSLAALSAPSGNTSSTRAWFMRPSLDHALLTILVRTLFEIFGAGILYPESESVPFGR